MGYVQSLYLWPSYLDAKDTVYAATGHDAAVHPQQY